MNPAPFITYFKSAGHAYAFALLHMEGPAKMELLGIARACYSEREEADRWLAEVRGALAGHGAGVENLALELYHEMTSR